MYKDVNLKSINTTLVYGLGVSLETIYISLIFLVVSKTKS